VTTEIPLTNADAFAAGILSWSLAESAGNPFRTRRNRKKQEAKAKRKKIKVKVGNVSRATLVAMKERPQKTVMAKRAA
jgi:hypothetical protein